MTVLFETVLRMSLTASVVILAVLLLRLPLRKAPKKISYALWSAVGFRLLCPVSFRSVFSLFRFMPGQVSGFFSGTPAETELSAPLVSAVQAELSAAPVLLQSAESAAGSLPLPDASAFSLPMQTFESAFASAPLAPAAEEAVRIAVPSAESAVPVPVDHAALFLKIGAAVWLAVMAVLLLYALVSAVLLKRRLRTAIRLSEGVYRSETVRSPFLLGFFKPRIYVPYGLEPDTLSYVLCHERYHLRRRDDLWKAVGFLALALHWFNPAVWVAFRLMTRDMEMSCDEHVLSENRQISRAYSMSLLSFAANRRFPAPSPLAFGETDVKKRIRNVLDWKKPKVWVTVLSALLCAAAIVACAANPKKPSAETLPETEAAAETAGDAEEEPEPAPADGFAEASSAFTGLQPSADIREHARKSAETIAEMVGTLYSEAISPDESPAGYVLYRRLMELGTLYQNLGGGDGGRQYTGSSSSRLCREDDAEWIEWIFGRTNILRFDLPALWSNLLVLIDRDFEENGMLRLSVRGPTYYSEDPNNENGGETDRAELFTLILVPAENTDDRTVPEGEGWNWLAAVDTKLNGMFQLWFRTDSKPSSEESAAEDERMRLEIPCILSTLKAPRSNVTILDTNPDYLSPDKETLARFAAIRQENDANLLARLDASLADLTEAFRILRSSSDVGVHSGVDPEISALLRPNGYGTSTCWINFSTPEGEDTAPDEAVLPGDSLPEEAPPENSLATEDIPAVTGSWPLVSAIIYAEYGWRAVYGKAEFRTGMTMTSVDPTVYAFRDGTVADVLYNDLYGNCILIDHGDGYCSLYGHLSPGNMAQKGSAVKEGDRIGSLLPASQENSFSPMMIFEVRYGGTPVNPRTCMNPDGRPAVSDDLAASFRQKEEEINRLQDTISALESGLRGLEQDIGLMWTETEDLRGGAYDPDKLSLYMAKISSGKALVKERKSELAALKAQWTGLRQTLKPFEFLLGDVMTKQERARVLHRDRLEAQYEKPEEDYGMSVLLELEAALSELSAKRNAMPEEYIILVRQEIENRRREEEEQAFLAEAGLEEQLRMEEELLRLAEAESEKKRLAEEQAAKAAVSDRRDDGNG